MISLIAIFLPAALALGFYALYAVAVDSRKRRTFRETTNAPLLFGFFHPYAYMGGGGERVLWTAIQATLKKWPNARILVYTKSQPGQDSSRIFAQIETQFRIQFPREQIEFVFVNGTKWMEARSWPRFTLIGQSLGVIPSGWNALRKKTPDVFIDTIGAAFLYPLAKIVFGCDVIAYVHYPVISTDMVEKVRSRVTDYNNNSTITQSGVLSTIKLWYYKLFVMLYAFVGSFADAIMVNSSWTKNHILQLWKLPQRTAIVFPPCDVKSLQYYAIHSPPRENIILSIAQFRPEKNHELQIRVFHEFCQRFPDRLEGDNPVKLVLVGGCRNAEDEDRVAYLKELVRKLRVKNVEFIINAPYEELLALLKRSSVGLHTMWNEHFGISIIEYMAAGLIPLAHDSGGPKLDIVVNAARAEKKNSDKLVVSDPGENQTGYLASTLEEYVACLEDVFVRIPYTRQTMIRQNARLHVLERFGEDAFDIGWVQAVAGCLARRRRRGNGN